MAEAASQQAGQPLKYTITHYRKQERTHEAFIKWLVEEHIPLALPILKKHGTLGYSLFVTPAPLNVALKQEIGKLYPSWDFADYDCVIEYTLPDFEVIKNVIADAGWAEAVKDQDNWVDTTKAMLSLGHSTPYLLENGEFVNLPK